MAAPQDMLSQLLPFLLSKDGSTLQARGVNTTQDMLSLLLSPEFALLTDSYYPQAAAQQNPPQFLMPTFDAYSNSGDAAVKKVANGLLLGEFDPTTAKVYLRNAISNGESSLMPEDVNSVIDGVWDDISKNKTEIAKWQQTQASQASDNPLDKLLGKAGLPAVNAQYDAMTVPQDAVHYQNFVRSQQTAADAARQYEELTKRLNDEETAFSRENAGPRGTPYTAEPRKTDGTNLPQARNSDVSPVEGLGIAMKGSVSEPPISLLTEPALGAALIDSWNDPQGFLYGTLREPFMSDSEIAAAQGKRSASKEGLKAYGPTQSEVAPGLVELRKANQGKRNEAKWAAESAQRKADFELLVRDKMARMMAERGKSPMSDALMQRMMALRQMGLIG